MRFFKTLIPAAGYTLYTLGVLFFLLWYMFPADHIRQKIEYELSKKTPGLQWKIGSLSLAFPGAVALRNITAKPSSGQHAANWKITSCTVRPELVSLFRSPKKNATYKIQLFGGMLSGRLELASDLQNIRYKGTMKGVDIKKIPLLTQMGRTASGVLAGKFTGSGHLQTSAVATLQGDFSLSRGTIAFLEPVLGMKQLDFKQIKGHVVWKKKTLRVTSGLLQAPLLGGSFAGTVNLQDNILASQLQLTGMLAPRPELMSSLGDVATVKMIKSQLKKGHLPFRLAGTLDSPGLFFGGIASSALQQPGRGRQ